MSPFENDLNVAKMVEFFNSKGYLVYVLDDDNARTKYVLEVDKKNNVVMVNLSTHKKKVIIHADELDECDMQYHNDGVVSVYGMMFPGRFLTLLVIKELDAGDWCDAMRYASRD